jgi:hypothetical protein
MKKYAVVLTVSLIISVEDDDGDIQDVVDELEYSFEPDPEHGAEVLDTEITDTQVSEIADNWYAKADDGKLFGPSSYDEACTTADQIQGLVVQVK